MKAIQLIRVSTGRQDLDQQREEVYKEVLRDGYSKANIISIEDIESAVKLSEEERQGLNKMKDAIERDSEINCVYIYEISRLSRRVEVVFSIIRYLQDHKIQLIILKPQRIIVFTDDWEMDRSATLLLSLFAGQAQVEGIDRRNRTVRGKIKARNEGKFQGGYAIFGYQADPKTKRVSINPKEYEIVRFIVDMYLTGMHSQFTICEELVKRGYKTKTGKEFTHTNIAHILRNENYLGNITYPQIITKEEWTKLRELVDKRRNKAKVKRNSIYYGRRKFFCWIGGKKMAMCVRRSTKVYQGGYPKGEKVYINLNQMDSLIWEFAKDMRKRKINDPLSIEDEKQETQEKIDRLNEDIKSYQESIDKELAKIERIEERLIKGRISESFAEKLELETNININDFKGKISQAKVNLEQLTEYLRTIQERVNIDSKVLDNLTDDTLRKQIIDEEIFRIDYIKKISFCKYVVRFYIHKGNISYDFLLNTHNSKREVYRYSEFNGEVRMKPYPVNMEMRFQKPSKPKEWK